MIDSINSVPIIYSKDQYHKIESVLIDTVPATVVGLISLILNSSEFSGRDSNLR